MGEFFKIFNHGVERTIPKMSKNKRGKKDWFNKRCEGASNKKLKAWKRWRNRRRGDLWEVYKQKQ